MMRWVRHGKEVERMNRAREGGGAWLAINKCSFITPGFEE